MCGCVLVGGGGGGGGGISVQPLRRVFVVVVVCLFVDSIR